MTKTALFEGLKEVGRLVVFALPAVLIQILTDNPALAGTYGTGILILLRALDKGVHEDETIEAKGILPF